MILDVGCGNDPKGDVNIDKEFYFSEHIGPGFFIHPKEYKNFIIANAENIPLRDDSMDLVYCSHVLEHLNNPFIALNEFKRISKNKIIVRIPNNGKTMHTEHKTHIYSWSSDSFNNFLNKIFTNYKIISNSSILVIKHRKIYQIMRKIPFAEHIISRLLFKYCIMELIGIAYKS